MILWGGGRAAAAFCHYTQGADLQLKLINWPFRKGLDRSHPIPPSLGVTFDKVHCRTTKGAKMMHGVLASFGS